MTVLPPAFAALEQEITACRKCPRLVSWREEVARVKRRAFLDQTYWGKPVPGFGDPNARILILGLAPGAHGSNRTGRMFTGDGSGDFLFPSLFRSGFASQPQALNQRDSMELKDVFISATCRCAPPANKPTPDEIRNCRPWLEAELTLLDKLQGVVFLGKIAFDGWLNLPRQEGIKKKDFIFGHNQLYDPGSVQPWMLCSYHPSLQNTQTGKLSAGRFDQIWQRAKNLLKE
jgi:uracil-DNA glycosylase family 4